MPVRAVEGLTIKAALLLGFGLTLGLWLWAAYDFTRRVADLEHEATAINERYMHAQELLASVRPQVLVVSVNVRNALLDPDVGKLPGYRERIARTLRDVDETLEQYVPVLNAPGERERVERLQVEIDAYGHAVLQAIEGGRARTAAEARDLLGRVLPRRELVIGVTDEVQALNRAAFLEQQREIADTHQATERAVWTRLGLSFAASFGIALAAAWYAGRLENRLRRQREIEAQHTRDLQRLSATLVHAQEEERRTIARELHDEVGQVLTAVRMELTVLQKRLPDEAAARVLDDALSITENALHSVRDLSHLLHPALLDDLGLAAAVDWYLQSFARRHEMRVSLQQSGVGGRLDPQVEITAYRIVQEALTNVARHAGARACTVTLRRMRASLAVTVEDDGRGFDAAAAQADGARAGLGLVSVRERAAQLRGSVRIESAAGAGTRVHVDLPLPHGAAARPQASPDLDDVAPAAAPEALGG